MVRMNGSIRILLVVTVSSILLGYYFAVTRTRVASITSTTTTRAATRADEPTRKSQLQFDTTSSRFLRKHAAEVADRVLNVHVVPHSHDDVGWRKTVEQYYYGTNNTIDDRGHVDSIIRSVLECLLENEAHTFPTVEMKFFSMWWNVQGEVARDNLRFLVANKQWSFVNGGWSMHDEASTHYMGMVDQTTLGHAFLKAKLGVVPTIGWQLDPFGHSATHADLTAAFGMDALYFGRIDYQDLALRQANKECEGLWGSNSSDSSVFWGLTGSYRGNYGAPEGFCFDVLCNDEPVLDLNETRMMERIETFLEDLAIQSNQTKGKNIMLTMGSDFEYQQAHVNFANMDRLIGSIMIFQLWGKLDITGIFGGVYDRVNIFYSTPEYYTQEKYRETMKATTQDNKIAWSLKTDDFFPYSDCPHCFWTGYFTSRTAFKRFERVSSAFLMAARQIDALPTSNSTPTGDLPLLPLDDALGVAQHHDAVSGTAKQHVADDYSERLQAGLDQAADYVIHRLKESLLEAPDTALKDLSYCQLLNETVCEVSEKASETNNTVLYVVVYNSLSSNRSSIVRLPVSTNATYRVGRVDADLELGDTRPLSITAPAGESKYVLFFDTGILPSLGAVAYRVSKVPEFPRETLTESDESSTMRVLSAAEGTLEVGNDHLLANFDGSTGMLTHISSPDKSGGLEISQVWGYYTSYDHDLDESDAEQNSGAYIFRPSTPNQALHLLTPKEATLVNSSLGVEVIVSFEEPWMKQVTRVLAGQPFVEIEYTIGPIPIDDGRGKEIVTRYMTSIESQGTFYTDSNGRRFIERHRDQRPIWDLEVIEPVAGNYYPVNAATYIEDCNASFAVLVDRSQGGGSLQDGQLELMVQRRTVADDARGVDEPLNETLGGMTPYPPFGNSERIGDGVVIRGIHRIMVGRGTTGASLARSAMDSVFAEPLVFVGSSPSTEPVNFNAATYSSLRESLPPNILLMTFVRIPDREVTTFLLRLAHQYDVEEDPELSLPATVDLAALLADYTLDGVSEKTLSGNEDWTVFMNRRLNWTAPANLHDSLGLQGTLVTLQPMEIRTFEIFVSSQ